MDEGIVQDVGNGRKERRNRKDIDRTGILWTEDYHVDCKRKGVTDNST